MKRILSIAALALLASATAAYAHGHLEKAVTLPKHQRDRLGLGAFRQRLRHCAAPFGQGVTAGRDHRWRVFSRHIGRQHIEAHYRGQQSTGSYHGVRFTSYATRRLGSFSSCGGA